MDKFLRPGGFGDEFFKHHVVEPEKYSIGARSKRRTALHVMDTFFLELVRRGQGMGAHIADLHRQAFLRTFWLKKDFFENPQENVSLKLLTDVCEYISAYGLGEDFFFRAGQYSSTFNRGTELHNYLRQARTVPEVFERQMEKIEFYDLNHDYRLVKMKGSSCIIRSVENTDARDAMGFKKFGSKTVCRTKMGIASAIVNFIGLPAGKVEHIRCVHEGDPFCDYEVDFSHADYQFRRKRLGVVVQ